MTDGALRPRTVRAQEAVRGATVDLLDEAGYEAFAVDEVARRSRVSKATIYKYWTGGFDLAVDSYGRLLTQTMPVATDGPVLDLLARQVEQVAAVYAGPRGPVIAQLIGAGMGDPARGALVRERFFGPRMEQTAHLVRRGQREGRLRADADAHLLVELLFGGIVFRLADGGAPLAARDARSLADMALHGAVAR